MKTTDTHGIGDSVMEKLPSPCNSRESFYEISEGSSHNSCASFKAICRAWKSRAEHDSSLSLQNRKDDLEVKLEDLTKRLSTTNNDDESKELAKSLSMYVMMESRPLQLTESSDENIPSGAGQYPQRFFTPEEIREAFTIFKMCDENDDSYIELPELKLALEKLAVPQTHLAVKELIAQVAGENVTKLNFCQFLLIYAATLQSHRENANPRNNSHTELMETDDPINVSEVGVSGAKLFFEAKIAQQNAEHSPELP
ncbi:hypothetical protein ACLKA7_008415 [Drosophila subpalustris]